MSSRTRRRTSVMTRAIRQPSSRRNRQPASERAGRTAAQPCLADRRRPPAPLFTDDATRRRRHIPRRIAGLGSTRTLAEATAEAHADASRREARAVAPGGLPRRDRAYGGAVARKSARCGRWRRPEAGAWHDGVHAAEVALARALLYPDGRRCWGFRRCASAAGASGCRPSRAMSPWSKLCARPKIVLHSRRDLAAELLSLRKIVGRADFVRFEQEDTRQQWACFAGRVRRPTVEWQHGGRIGAPRGACAPPADGPAAHARGLFGTERQPRGAVAVPRLRAAAAARRRAAVAHGQPEAAAG